MKTIGVYKSAIKEQSIVYVMFPLGDIHPTGKKHGRGVRLLKSFKLLYVAACSYTVTIPFGIPKGTGLAMGGTPTYYFLKYKWQVQWYYAYEYELYNNGK